MRKLCNKCNTEKEISEFYKHHITKDGYCNQCKDCKRQINNAWYTQNKTHVIKKVQAYQKERPGQVAKYKRKSDLRRKYNLTPEEYDQMYMTQLGLCSVCHDPFGEEVPCVDHCHSTGKVRGLLHDRCNRVLGQANDSIELLQSAIEYLQKHM